MNQADYDHYWEEGWAVIEGIYATDEVDSIAQLVTEISNKGLEDDASSGVVDRQANGAIAPRKINRPFLRELAFQSLVLDLRLSAIISSLIGVEPLLVTDQIFMKPPRFGSAKPYHQDNYYFKCEPADNVITAWITWMSLTVACVILAVHTKDPCYRTRHRIPMLHIILYHRLN